MTSKSEVTLTFAGDSKQLEKTFDRVGNAADGMSDDIKRASNALDSGVDGFDRVGEGFGTLDQRAMGFRDTITGVQDGFAGLTDSSKTAQERLLLVGTGVGDLASGFENLIIPMVKTAVQSGRTAVTMVANYAKAAVAATVSIAKQVASWIVLGAQSLLAAAKVAAAWLISLGPIALVIIAVLAIVALIIANWDTIKEVIAKGWEFVKRITATVWDFIKGLISTVGDAIKAYFSFVFNAYKTVITTAWNAIKATTSAVWNAIKAVISKIGDGIKAYFTTVFNAYKTVITTTWNTVKTLTTNAFNTVKSTITRIFNAVKTFMTNRINDVVGLFRRLPGRITSALSGVTEAFKRPFRAAFDGIRSLWNNSLGGKGISIPGFGPFGGLDFTIPKLAQGGIIPATNGGLPFIGGEAGQAEAVIPLDRLEGMMGGGGGGTTVIEIRSSGSDVDDFVVNQLRKSISNRGGTVEVVLGRR